MAKGRIPNDLQTWIDVRSRHHLSDAEVQMARELGLNPKEIGNLANHRQEPWKEPLPQFIATMYERRFGRRRPEHVVSIEKRAAELAKKRRSAAERQEPS